MKPTVKKVGAWILGFGIAVLLAGIILSVTLGTVLVPIFLSSSVLINTAGITMILHKKRK